MELWIRSQDKKLLVQAKEVKAEVFVGKKLYSPYTNEEIITFDGDDKFYVIRVNSEIVGEYKTEERCLEILDEVQKILSEYPVPLLVFTNCDVTEDIYNGLNEMYKKGDLLALRADSPQENVKIVEKSTVVYEMPEK